MSDIRMCALPGCSARINPLAVYTIKDRSEQFCSRECVDAAFDLVTKAKKKGKEDKAMRALAEDFGDSGVTRGFCDWKRCGLAILICWKGRKDQTKEYCSHACRDTAEREENQMTETNATATATADAPPIVAGTPDKKRTKKVAAKKAAAKKAAAKPANKAAKGKFADDAVITVKGKDHGRRGKAAECMNLLKTGMTVAQLREKIAKKEGLNSGYLRWTLDAATESGYATVK